LAEIVKLTATAKAGGCASKLSPGLLDSVLRRLPRSSDPNLLVGFETNDDAGVYRLTDDVALVQTVDFFTPIVDDAYTYGQIAAANALSDVYAMGGRPISALSVVGFPPGGAPETLEQIMRGGLSKMSEAQCTVLGGHSVRDEDLKFGYAVTGLIDPQRVWRNVGAQPGDVLLLTKPLGTGVISTALKRGGASDAALNDSIASMTRLNRDAAFALRELEEGTAGSTSPVHAVTDITGFSLLGHAREMAVGSKVSFSIDHSRIAFLAGAIEAARGGFLSAGLKNNREFVSSCAEFASSVGVEFQHLLFDPQTSGGLFIAIAPNAVQAALAALARHSVAARAIGEVGAPHSPLLEVH
jgi:selenide, water dikinase